LHSNSAVIEFRTKSVIAANTEDTTSQALIFGGKYTDKTKADPKKVLQFLSNSTLRGWKQENGRENGLSRTEAFLVKLAEHCLAMVRLEGKEWGDVEVELDFVETGTDSVHLGLLSYEFRNSGYST